MTAPVRLARVQLYLIATPPEQSAASAGLPEEWVERVGAAVRGGVEAVQLRLKDADTAARRRALARLRETLPPEVLLLVNDDAEAVFDASGAPLADGVHLGREDLQAWGPAEGSLVTRRSEGLRRVRALLGPELALGTSTREPWELELAAEGGADHVGFGAMAPSATKTDTQSATLDELVRVTRAAAPLVVFPIGGLDAAHLEEFARRGIRRAAVGSAILSSPDPEQAARAARAALGPLQM